MAKEIVNPNLDIYEKARSVPNEAIKEIRGGRLAGFSDINPMWRIKRLTEIFGPCGKGWYYEITDKRTETAGNETAMFITISLYVKYGEEWSKPIVGVGGSKMVAMEKQGPYFSDEVEKMALTDALSVAMKSLGVAADIYFSKDRTKYDTESGETAAPAAPSASKAPTPRAAAKAAEIPAFDLNAGIKEVLGATSREQLQQIFAQRKSMLAGDDLKTYKQTIAKRDKELSDEAKAK